MAKNTDTSASTEETTAVKHLEFFSWLQEFTKKVVSVTFIMFALANIFYMIVMWITFNQADMEILAYMDNFINLMHVTFRDVIGGYIIKAAAENVIKIGGSYMEDYLKYKISKSKDNKEDKSQEDQ